MDDFRQLAESFLSGMLQLLIGLECVRTSTGNPNWPSLSPSKPHANQQKGVEGKRSAAEGS